MTPSVERATAVFEAEREMLDDLRRGPLAGRGGVPVRVGAAREWTEHEIGYLRETNHRLDTPAPSTVACSALMPAFYG